jgi:hypothetical protein
MGNRAFLTLDNFFAGTFITQARFTKDGLNGMIAAPEDRGEIVGRLIAQVGGKLTAAFQSYVRRRSIEQRVCGPGDVVVIPAGSEHEGWFHEDGEVIDFFAPPREDFLLGGKPAYMSEG